MDGCSPMFSDKPQAKRSKTLAFLSLCVRAPNIYLELAMVSPRAASPDVDSALLSTSDTSISSECAALAMAERRRVNPESLAGRLGPEVVAELERHIEPGSIEMPPFSVRRKVQVDFNVDRRHIYDFYHSRGLRCLRNERATRTKKREAASDPVIIEDTTSRSRSSRGLPIPDYSEPRRRRRAAPYDTTASPKNLRKSRKSSSVPDFAPDTPPRDQPSRSSSAASSCMPESPGEVPVTSPHVPVPASPPRDMPQAPPPSPMSSSGSTTDSIASLESMEQYLSSLEPERLDTIVISADLGDEGSAEQPTDSNVLPLAHFSLLSPQEKQQPYSWLSNVLGPADGIQESMGSYKQYMDQQRDAYYSPLIDNASHSPKPRLESSASKPVLTSAEATMRAVSRTMRASARTPLGSSGLHARPALASRPSTTKPSIENAVWPAMHAPVPVVARPRSASFLQPLRTSSSFNTSHSTAAQYEHRQIAPWQKRLHLGPSETAWRQAVETTPSAIYARSHSFTGHLAA